MKILFLSPYLPWPPGGGPTLRIFGILKELSTRGHEVVLLAGHDGPALAPDSPLAKLCKRIEFYRPPSSSYRAHPVVAGLRTLLSPFPFVVAKYRSTEVRRAIRRELNNDTFDLIFAVVTFMADSIPPEFSAKLPVVVDELESEGLLWRQYVRQGNVLMKGFALLNLLKLVWFQKRLGTRIAAILCVSEREKKYARGFVPKHVAAWTVPNGVDADAYSSLLNLRPATKAIILCGVMGVYRNAQAALWFTRSIFPRVREEVPDAELWLVGAGPTEEVRALGSNPGVHVTGTVDDVRPYYQKAVVSVAPYRFGEGTKLKVLEAMACGVPIISTSIGCQGLDVVDGEHVLIANTEEDFAARVIALFHDAPRRAKLASAARKLVEQKYTWKKIVDNLEPELRKLAEPHDGARV